ncbi:unnamed protein product [Larinioides sclopetarius]|uniref:receptor protein serine/threonine kinase n=1 Tax=Larinioides sclopetarius TaxID=280406 RepID=A0AAV1ZJI7_9ARAC
MYLQLLLIFATSASIMSKRSPGGPYTCYECQASGCSSPYNKTCDGALSCYTAIDVVKKKYLLEKGCFRDGFVRLSFCNYKNFLTQVTNCCEGHFCNDDEFPSIPDHWTPSPKVENKQLDTEEANSTHVDFSKFVLPVIIAVIISFIAFISIRIILSNNKSNLLPICYDKHTLHTSSDSIVASGSRSSTLTLNQRGLAQDITLIECIGQGRFGRVWKGAFHGENVAVKITPTRDEASWKNEVNIYTKISLYHENVLGFKGCDIITRDFSTEMWLLTAFHEQGSLYDYLLENTITLNKMMQFVRSICSGLLHLHTEMFGSKGKPAIAHRDLKTRNILLTSHGTCVIADFGLAVVNTDESPSINLPINYRVGTKRYMAPEILDDSIKTNSFESFKKADIYSFGLVLWEVCSRCTTDGIVEAYQPPFHDCVPNNPDFEDMKKVVCVESKRPEIPDSWSSDKHLNAVAILMKECWHKNPEVRPTVCRTKKTLDRINADMQELEVLL